LLVITAVCTAQPSEPRTVPKALEDATKAVIDAIKAPLSLLNIPVRSSETQTLVAMSKISLCYDLQRDRWLTFRVPIPGERIEAVTNACLPKTGAEDPNAVWTYSVDYELSDSGSGRVLKDGTYHFRTRLTKFRPEESILKTEITAAFFLDQEQVPADGRLLVFNMKDFGKLKGAVLLRLRVNSRDPEVQDVVARIFNREPTSAFRLDHMWLRMTPRQKQQLAIGSVYPPDLLTDQEKRTISSKLWKPVAPTGIQGRDYVERKIYVVRDIELSPVEEPIIPAGMYVDERLVGTMPVPEAGKRVRFVVRSLEPNASRESTSLSVQWYGPTIADRRSYVLPLDHQGKTSDITVPGGLLEIESRVPVIVKPEWLADGTEVDATPENLYSRTYVLHDNHDVKYSQTHVNGKPTPFRADFRVVSRVEVGRSYKVSYDFLDEQGHSLRTGTIDFKVFPSKFDRAQLGFSQALVSDPVSYFFDVPPKVASVTFHAGEPILVNAYTRPPDLVTDTRVPEDFYREIPPSPLREPSWFGVYAAGDEQLMREGRIVLVKVQLRPPEDDRDVLAGRFVWDTFYGTGSWSGQFILAPENEDVPYQRRQSLLSGCRRLAVGEPLQLDIQSDQGLEVVRPILVFLRPDATGPFKIRVVVDGEQIYDDEVIGTRGTVLLPPLPMGNRMITIEAPKDCTVLMNSVASAKPNYMLHFACHLKQNGLNVECLKRSKLDETLAMTLFSPYGETKRTVVRVRLKAHAPREQGPLNGLTILDRRFTVKPSAEGPFPVMNAPTENVDAGQIMLFPMSEDIPPGRYMVQVDLEEGAGGYVLFSTVLPGSHEEMLIRHEAVLAQNAEDGTKPIGGRAKLSNVAQVR